MSERPDINIGAWVAALSMLPSVRTRTHLDIRRTEPCKPKRKRAFKGSKAAKRQSRKALQGRSSNQ